MDRTCFRDVNIGIDRDSLSRSCIPQLYPTAVDWGLVSPAKLGSYYVFWERRGPQEPDQPASRIDLL